MERQKNRAAALWAGVLLTCGCNAPPDWDQRGLYVGGGFSYGWENFDLDDAEDFSRSSINAHDAPGGDARLGYRFLPLFGAELNFQAYDEFDLNVRGIPDDAKVEDLWTLTLNLKGYTNLTDRIDAYGFVGLGIMSAELNDDRRVIEEFDHTDGVFRGGVGLELALTDQLRWFVEGAWLEPWGDLEGVRVAPATTGLTFRF